MKKKQPNIFNRLTKVDRRELDNVFHEAHETIFTDFDCLSCGNCCKSIPPVVRNADIRRISASLRMKPSDFAERYTRMDEDDEMVMNTSPCPFLQPDNTCRIYDHRPLACSEYPHTDRTRMYQILQLTEKNNEICPAVNEIMKLVEKAFPAPVPKNY